MSLNNQQKKRYRSIGHDLHPIVTIAGNGVTENILTEIDRALNDHELIKIKVIIDDRTARAAAIQHICKKTASIDVQQIGKVALLLREAKRPNTKLSNIR